MPRAKTPAKSPVKRTAKAPARRKPTVKHVPPIDQTVFAHILQAIEFAVEPHVAALADGVDAERFDAALAVDAGMRAAVEQAVARCEVWLAGRVAAGADDWQAHRWLLERRFADRWARTPAPVLADRAKAADAPAAAQVVEENVLARMRREREERARDAAHHATQH